MKQKILVTGATGSVGPRVVEALYEAGCQICTLSIDPPLTSHFPDGVESLLGDVTDPSNVRAAMRGVDGVVHLAALLHIVSPPAEMREKFENVNVHGTKTVLEAAIKAEVKRFIFFSTIAVYRLAHGGVLNESSPTHPETFYAQTKLVAEKVVLNAKRADGQPIGTVLRLGAVYGSRIKGNYQQLARALAQNRFIHIGNGLNRRTLIYDKDVARAAVLAISHPAAPGRLFNVTDGEFHTMNDIIESICSAIGRKPPRLSLPIDLARALAGLVEVGSRTIGVKPPIAREMIDKYTEDIAVDGTLIQKQLGFTPQFDLKTGWVDTIREMKHEKGL